MKRFSMCVLAVAAVAMSGLLSPEQVQARPTYLPVFKKEYSKLDQTKVDDNKCGICHGGEKGANKKKLSKYAQELKKHLEKTEGFEKFPVKGEENIKSAFKAAEKADAGDGKTFGDLLKAGTFPAPAE